MVGMLKILELRNCRHSGPPPINPIYVGSSSGQFDATVPKNIFVDSCFIHDNGNEGSEDHGLYIGYVDGMVVFNSVFTRNKAWDIQAYPCPRNLKILHTVLDRADTQGGAVIGGNSEHRGQCTAENVVIANTISSNNPAGAFTDYGAEGNPPRNVVIDTCAFFNNRGNTKGGDYYDNDSTHQLVVRHSVHANPHYANSHGNVMTSFAARNKRLNVANSAFVIELDARGHRRPLHGATIGAFQNTGGVASPPVHPKKSGKANKVKKVKKMKHKN